MSLDEAFRLLNSVHDLVAPGEPRNRALLYAGGRAGIKAEEIAGGYPPASGKPLAVFYNRTDTRGRPYKSKFKSRRQQGKVFSLIAAGKVPYVRSGRLGASLTSEAQIVGTGVVVTVGTNRPGAKYVIGNEMEQSFYHRGTWTPLQQQMDEHSDVIIQEFSTSLINYVRGYIRERW